MRLSAQRAEIEITFLYMAGTCNTLEKSKGVGREVREKEPMLAIYKPKPSPMITLSEKVYGS